MENSPFMTEFDNYYYLGKIIKPHGFDGKVNVYLDTDEPWSYQELDMVFVNQQGSAVPYFIEKIAIKNNKATITFTDVSNLEQAEALAQKEMYLPLSTLPELTGNRFYFHEVVGFTIVDAKFGKVGSVKEVLDYPNQPVFQILNGEQEILVPASKDVIRKVDRENKTIEIEAPEGLIEIYLQ